MKKLLLLSLLCGSAVMFSMKPKKPNYTLTIVMHGDYEERELKTGKKIDNLVLDNKELYGEIKKNSIISVKSFALPNKKEQYGEYRLVITTDKTTKRFSANGKVIFTLDYNERAKENDSYEAPLFGKLLNDLASFKENNLEKIKSFFYEKKSHKGCRSDLLNTIFVEVLDESPEIVFPTAYEQKKRYDSTIAPLYEISKNRSYKLKHF